MKSFHMHTIAGLCIYIYIYTHICRLCTLNHNINTIYIYIYVCLYYDSYDMHHVRLNIYIYIYYIYDVYIMIQCTEPATPAVIATPPVSLQETVLGLKTPSP